MTRTDVDWTAVRADYEARDLTIADVTAKYAISESCLYDQVHKQGWPPRMPGKPVSREALIRRLYRLLEAQILQLETETGMAGDKEVALLATLTRNLEKLMEMERKQTGAAKAPRRQSDITELRAKLARRIDELRGR